MSNKKGIKNKIGKGISNKDMYKNYLNNLKDKSKAVNYTKYSQIIRACNLKVIEKIAKESDYFYMPFREGILTIKRFDRSFNKKLRKFPVNWKLSNDLGFIVYHDQHSFYGWRWVKKDALLIGKTRYKFIASRRAKREVPKQINNKVEYFR